MLSRMLLSDLAMDQGRDDAARSTLLSGVGAQPGSPFAPTMMFQGAMIAYSAGRYRVAALELDSLVFRYPGARDLVAALYWSGRAWHDIGDTTEAQLRWRAVVTTAPHGYYSMGARRRLGLPQPEPRPAPVAMPLPEAVAAVRRVALLEDLGLDPEARLETAELYRQAGASVKSILGTAAAFADAGFPAHSIRLTTRALALGAPRDRATTELLYPLPREDGLRDIAESRSLDPALVAGLIRQESKFDPRATSKAGARGLMQVMPEVGARIARRDGYPVWDPVLLYQPDVSLDVGTIHLKRLFRQYQGAEQVLAAYNAGGRRVRRWLRRRGTADPELFIERIPFRETRDYVRIVLLNRAVYQTIYQRAELATGPPPPSVTP